MQSNTNQYNQQKLTYTRKRFDEEINKTFNVALKDYLKYLKNIDSSEYALKILKEAVLDHTIDGIINNYNTYYENLQKLKQEEYLKKFNTTNELKESYNEVKNTFLNQEKEVLEIRKQLIKAKKLEKKKEDNEKTNKQQEAINDTGDLQTIFTNRVGRGFFKIFGRGKPNLQRILSEIGLQDIKEDIVIDDAKPKLIEKFKDPKTAKLAFKAACQNNFNRQAFDSLAEINDKNSQLIYENNKLKEENKEMKAEIEDCNKVIKSIEDLSDEDPNKSNISAILSAIKNIYQAKPQGDEEAKNLMNKLNENIVVIENAMKEELKTQDDKLQAKLSERQQKKNVTTVPQVNDNTQQSSKSLNQNHENDLYRRQSIQRTSSKENLHVQTLVSKRRNSQSSQGSPREQQ